MQETVQRVPFSESIKYLLDCLETGQSIMDSHEKVEKPELRKRAELRNAVQKLANWVIFQHKKVGSREEWLDFKNYVLGYYPEEQNRSSIVRSSDDDARSIRETLERMDEYFK